MSRPGQTLLAPWAGIKISAFLFCCFAILQYCTLYSCTGQLGLYTATLYSSVRPNSQMVSLVGAVQISQPGLGQPTHDTTPHEGNQFCYVFNIEHKYRQSKSRYC